MPAWKFILWHDCMGCVTCYHKFARASWWRQQFCNKPFLLYTFTAVHYAFIVWWLWDIWVYKCAHTMRITCQQYSIIGDNNYKNVSSQACACFEVLKVHYKIQIVAMCTHNVTQSKIRMALFVHFAWGLSYNCKKSNSVVLQKIIKVGSVELLCSQKGYIS